MPSDPSISTYRNRQARYPSPSSLKIMEPPLAPTTSTTSLPQPRPLSQDTRHAEMQARFRAQQEARMQSRKDSKAKDQLGKDPKESVGVFWTELRRAHEDVTRRLDSLALIDTSPSSTNITSSSSSSSSSVDETLANLGSKVQALDKQIADAALFLPPYDVRRAQEEATALRSKLEEVRAALAPRRKFSFSARRRAAAAAAAGEAGAVDGSTSSSAKQTQAFISSAVAPPPSQTSTTIAATTTDGSSELQAMEGFSSLSDATLNLNTLLSSTDNSSSSNSSSSSTTTHPKDLLLRDLTRCTIHLLGPLHFLRLENLTDCKLLCGPVAGSVYLEKCQGCTLYLASRQLRIHNTYDTTLYVHTVSGPIIEDCDRLKFAPWGLSYPGWEEQFVEAGLRSKEEGGRGGREGGRNAWKEVKDFKWLRAQQSPHWSVVPEGERVREGVVGGGGGDGGEEGEEGEGRQGEEEEKEEEEL